MRFNRFKPWSLLIGVAFLALVFVGCTAPQNKKAESPMPAKVAIAYQPGIGYANLILVKHQQTLEKQFPKTQFEWKELASGSAIRDGILANQLQVGAGGIRPFLVGWEKGVGWKILASLNHMDFWLVVKDSNIKSLKDFKPEMKIGLPAPDSIQAVVLRRAAQKELGNPTALDGNILAIAHPLGVQALLSGRITGHLTTPPFQFQEVEKGGQAIVKSASLFGKSSGDSVFMTEQFYKKYPDFANALYSALLDATKLLNEKPDEAAKLLSQEGGGKVPPEQYKKWITNDAVQYSVVPKAFLKHAEFMQEIGMLNKKPKSIDELILPTLRNNGGN